MEKNTRVYLGRDKGPRSQWSEVPMPTPEEMEEFFPQYCYRDYPHNTQEVEDPLSWFIYLNGYTYVRTVTTAIFRVGDDDAKMRDGQEVLRDIKQHISQIRAAIAA